MDKVQSVIIGAGVVGLSVAERLFRRCGDVVVVERHDSFGQETSSRNSEVIHAGLYYASDLLKTRLCVCGNPLLYELCGVYGIQHRRTGRIVAAALDAELAALERIWDQARANGVQGVRLLSGCEVTEMEPQVKAVAGLFRRCNEITD